ncbi:EamA family transporter [Labedella endophytica]|uniref:DMT family transporter n=1 Tax=Labedella endophytica TaxID=1523160 RepID=A0A433JW84_9MICO|nr:DMT family transporter [Labedella endophytica]RUR03466.1 DMT family transporter [Labedella endophytica]
MRATTSPASGVLIGVLSALAFGASGPFVKTLLEAGWSPGSAVFARTLGAAIVLTPLGLWAVRGRWGIARREWRLIVGFGIIAVAGAQLCYFAAVSRMPVGISLLIEYLAPVLLVLAAWARTRRAPRGRMIGGSALSIGGLVLVIDITGATPDVLGVVFALGAAICLGFYFVLSARPTELPPVALAAGGLLVATIALGSALLVGALPASAPLVDVDLLGAVVPWWVPLGVIVLVATAFAYVTGIVAAGRMGERLASFVGLSEVLFAVVIAWLLLGEVPSVVQALGGVLIVAGVVVVRLDGAGRASTAPLDLPTPAPISTP